MRKLAEELEKVLRDAGAELVGYGDMSEIENVPYPTGVIIAISQPIQESSDVEYNHTRKMLSKALEAGTSYLESKGYKVHMQGRDGNRIVPHKTIATRAGLGWIGKNCLLITPEFGAGVRLASMFTDAILPYAQPINESKCGDCRACVDACPGKALKGTLWKVGVSREEILDKEACQQMRNQVWKDWTGPGEFSENCIAACPYTRK